MFRRLAACGMLLASLFVLTAAAVPSDSIALSFCGACEDDDACGTGHKCCKEKCTNGTKKCLRVATCP
jgi:hypothetical protein